MRHETIFSLIAGAISISVIASVTIALVVLNEKQASEPPFLYEENGKTWVQIDPIQCGCNPWELEWNGSDSDDNTYFPGGIGAPELDQQEIEIIKDYYQRQGVTVFDLKSRWTYDAVCLACSCPVGYTLYLLVSDSDVDRMLQFGYKIS